jgi:hypothetical protein
MRSIVWQWRFQVWVRQYVPDAWYERYGKRIEQHRLPKGKQARAALAQRIGEDGYHLLELIEHSDPMGWLKRYARCGCSNTGWTTARFASASWTICRPWETGFTRRMIPRRGIVPNAARLGLAIGCISPKRVMKIPHGLSRKSPRRQRPSRMRRPWEPFRLICKPMRCCLLTRSSMKAM